MRPGADLPEVEMVTVPLEAGTGMEFRLVVEMEDLLACLGEVGPTVAFRKEVGASRVRLGLGREEIQVVARNLGQPWVRGALGLHLLGRRRRMSF